jgi:putative two-component system hydrogenase maturation factor HypX/HoxX
MRILLLAHSFNSLSQRLLVELTERGHTVSVELDINDAVLREAVASFSPDVIVAPFLKRAIAEDVWRNHRCLIVHPGIPGDRGPSALDWALLEGESEWGVTVLQAEAEMDAGPVWASASFPLRAAPKSSVYRREVTDAAVQAVLTAIDWQADSTETVLRKIRSADGSPGVLDSLFGRAVRIYDAHGADGVRGRAGEVIARCGDALARATSDGAVWIGHVREERSMALKLPTGCVFAAESAGLPAAAGYEPIRYEEEGEVGLLHFELYNGAMSTAQCSALRAAYGRALERPTRVLLLLGGPDYWSNGIHLGMIEAAESPAEESWRNINAIDDLARDIITTTDRLVISALRGGAGAGGVFLALAADEVWACPGVVLNPHYKDMGNLYGSEYWTYLLPRRVGEEEAARIMQRRLPMGVAQALRLGLIDRLLPDEVGRSPEAIAALARAIGADETLERRIAAKQRRRESEERAKPLESYRAEELARMHRNFFGFDPSYHVARYNFIYKIPKSRTPLPLARHRARAAVREESAHV